MVRTLGSLRNEDGNGYENVTQKVNLRCLKLNRAYSVSFNLSMVGIFLELNSKGLHQSSGKEKKAAVFYSRHRHGLGGGWRGRWGWWVLRVLGETSGTIKSGNDKASKKPLVRLDC